MEYEKERLVDEHSSATLDVEDGTSSLDDYETHIRVHKKNFWAGLATAKFNLFHLIILFIYSTIFVALLWRNKKGETCLVNQMTYCKSILESLCFVQLTLASARE